MLALIEARLDTRMWNEGFEQAREPWATAYTTNQEVAGYYTNHPRLSIPNPAVDTFFPQDFDVRVLRLDESFKPPAVKTFEHLTPQQQAEDNDFEIYEAARYIGVLAGNPQEQIKQFNRRLLAWDGI